jgi:hypothetical protein
MALCPIGTDPSARDAFGAVPRALSLSSPSPVSAAVGQVNQSLACASFLQFRLPLSSAPLSSPLLLWPSRACFAASFLRLSVYRLPNSALGPNALHRRQKTEPNTHFCLWPFEAEAEKGEVEEGTEARILPRSGPYSDRTGQE